MPYSDRVLLTVHGVNSTNDGLAVVRSRCEASLPGITCDSYNFGKMLPYKELTDSVRQFVYRTVRDRFEIINLTRLLPERKRCFVVCHSFGTLAVVRALEMNIPNFRIEGLILLGSIVPRDYLWDGLVNSGLLQHPPLSVVRPFDMVVQKARLVGGGPSGAEGFIATGVHRPREIHKNGGHCGYDPHDVNDIITAIRDGVNVVPTKDRRTWLGEQSIIKRCALGICRKL